MRHVIRFDMPPIGHKTANNEIGKQIMVVGEHTILIRYDIRKLFLNMRKPSAHKLKVIEIIELTSCLPFSLNNEVTDIEPARINKVDYFSKVPIMEWWKHLGFYQIISLSGQ